MTTLTPPTPEQYFAEQAKAMSTGYMFADLLYGADTDRMAETRPDGDGPMVSYDDGVAHALQNLTSGFISALANAEQEADHACYRIGRSLAKLDLRGARSPEREIKVALHEANTSEAGLSTRGNSALALEGVLDVVIAVRNAFKAGLQDNVERPDESILDQLPSAALVIAFAALNTATMRDLEVWAEMHDLDSDGVSAVGRAVADDLLESSDPSDRDLAIAAPTAKGLSYLAGEFEQTLRQGDPTAAVV